MNQDSPVVSIFLPTYNQEKFIGKAIESTLEQDYPHMEIIVGDDCSTDSTWDIVRNYEIRYPDKIKAFRNDKNLGITGNCNEVLKRCSGKYIAFHAGDDVFLPGKIKAQIEAMESDKNCILCYHDVEVFDSSDGGTIRFWNSGLTGAKPVQGNSSHVARRLVKEGTRFMAALGVMVRKSALPEGGYDQRIPIASDWLMWVEICAGTKGNVIFLDNVFSRYRKHQNSITANQQSFADQFVTLAVIETKYPWLLTSVKQARKHLYYYWGMILLQNSEFRHARSYLIKGRRPGMGWWKLYAWWAYCLIKQIDSPAR